MNIVPKLPEMGSKSQPLCRGKSLHINALDVGAVLGHYGFLVDTCYLLMDRDTKHCEGFRSILEDTGVHCVRLPPRSPNLNAHIERFMRSIKEECLGRMVFFGEDSLRRAIYAFVEHYHTKRNHQGLENRIIEPAEGVGSELGNIACRERLGGMLRYYYRVAT